MNPVRMLSVMLVVVLVLYIAICGLMWFAQDSMIFQRQPLRPDSVEVARSVGAEELKVTTPEGISLYGWLRKAHSSGPSPLLIYFGGNAEEVTGMLGELQRYPAMAVALVNYRAYGQSEGAPSEKALLADGVMVYDALAVNPNVDSERIIVMGRSLGTGVAIYVASERKVRAVMLVSPYDSLTSVAARVYPWLPVAQLIRHPFDSLSRAARIASPMLALAGTLDDVVPPEHSKKLRDAWKGNSELQLLEGSGHNDLMGHLKFWRTVDDFLRRAL